MSSLYEMLKAARASAVPAGEAEDGVARNMIADHKANQNNPHKVTKAQVGLSNVDNTADIDKPVSAAVQSALNSAIAAESDAREAADDSKQNALTTEQLAAVNSGITSTDVTQIETNKNNISLLYEKIESELHALLPNITSSTTIRDYVDSLSKGVYTAFIANVSNPSDSPINANCFVNIYVYSATTAAVELIPISSNELQRTYTNRKVAGTWRGWYMVEGTPVTTSTENQQ